MVYFHLSTLTTRYHHHIESIAAANLEKQFKASLKHCYYVCREFSLVEGKDVGPLMHVADKLESNESLLEVFRHFQEKEAALSKPVPSDGTRRRSHSVDYKDINPKERGSYIPFT